MPLFKSNPDERNDDVQRSRSTSHKNGSPTRKGTLFGGRRRSVSPEPSARSSNRGGLFRRRSSSDDSSLGRSGSGAGSVRSGGSGGFFGFGGHNSAGNDPTIMAARQKVHDAETAEREADRALLAARAMVKEARDHVKMLEREAEEDARRAKLKQAEAKVVSKTARSLGRHG